MIIKNAIDVKKAKNDEYLESIKQKVTNELNNIGETKRIRFY